jgi:hypothetical protein
MSNPTFLSPPPDVRIQRILQNVQTHVPGAIENVIQLELYNCMDEFFKESNVWTQDINFNVLGDNTTVSYTIVATNGGTINRLIWVKNSNGARVSNITMHVPGTIVLQNAMSTADTWTARVACTVIDPTDSQNYPTNTADGWIYDRYGNVFQDGTIGRLMMQPAKPYSNQQLGIYHTRRFMNGVSLARSEAARQNLYGVQQWRFPLSYAVRRSKM